jgi:hypothetical protein
MADQPLSHVSPGQALLFIGGVGLLLALFGVVPIVLEQQRVWEYRKTLMQTLAQPSSEAVKGELAKAVRDPGDVRGFTRGLIAFLIIVLIGLGLAVAMLTPTAADTQKTIITSLTTVLATLAGFYFGSRTAQDARRNEQQGAGTLAGGQAERKAVDKDRQDPGDLPAPPNP